jgi:hypothetical protein
VRGWANGSPAGWTRFGNFALYKRSIAFWHYVRMPDEHNLTLRQADQARADFAVIEDDLRFLMSQLARIPTRAYLCRTVLMATSSLWALFGVVVLLLLR